MSQPLPQYPSIPVVEAETPADRDGVLAVVAAAFGPGRFAKTAERLREGARPLVSLVARDGGSVVGSVRLWPIRIGEVPAAFLGPIAVDEAWRRSGVGAVLVERACEEAAAMGLASVLLVGDAPYFGRFGFVRAEGVVLPGPADPRRILIRTPGGESPRGPVRRDAA